MNILIDGQTLHTYERHRGIGRYVIEVLKQFVTQSPDDNIIISTFKEVDLCDLPEVIKKSVKFRMVDLDSDSCNTYLKELQHRQALEDIVSQERIDIYWNPNPLMTNVFFAGKIKGCHSIATVHDVIPLIFPQAYLDNLPMDVFENYMTRLIKLSSFDHVIAVSQSTKDDLIKHTSVQNNKISVIHEGVDSSFFEKVKDDDRNEIKLRYGLPGDFIFTIGGPNFRKNNNNLMKAFSILINKYSKDICLVIGSSYDVNTKDEMKTLARNEGIADRVMFIGEIPDGDLPVIYNISKIFVFPSLYEGFGLPVLEAMATGRTVVVSSNSSVPEVVGDCGLYFDPYNVEDMAGKMNEVLDDINLLQAMSKAAIIRAREFGWDKTAKQMLQIMESLLIEKPKKEPSIIKPFNKEKMRLAFFSPLNPQHSGISDYSEELLVHLKEYAEIDLFVDGISPSDPEILNNFRYYDYKDFEKKEVRRRYDNIIYHMGNNTLHEYIYSTLNSYPGITVLHDYNIHPFTREITLGKGKPELYLSEIQDCYGVIGRLISNRIIKENFNLDSNQFTLNNKIFNKSKAVIVHSEWIKNQFASDNIYVIPMGTNIEQKITREDISAIRKEKSMSDDLFIISCFGDIVHTKRLDIVIKAFSIFRLFFKNVKLILVGKLYKEMEGKIQKLIERYNLKESLCITEKVSLEEFKKYMKASDVIVNLRYPTMGETSASLIRAMSYSKPVIISNVNQYREYPDDCCLKVDVGSQEQDQLLNCLMRLKKDESMRKWLGENARKYVGKNCSWEKIAARYVEVIEYHSEKIKINT